MKSNIFALIAAVGGGVVGYFGFFWIAKQGYYALILPGGLAGLAASHFRSKSISVCIACGVLALTFGLYTECTFRPFRDASLGYFLTHVHQRQPVTLIMLAVGTAIGFWLPFSHRNDGAAKQRR